MKSVSTTCVPLTLGQFPAAICRAAGFACASRWDNTNVTFLGYKPVDDTEIYAAEILARGEAEDEISAQFHGGFSTPMEFDRDASKID